MRNAQRDIVILDAVAATGAGRSKPDRTKLFIVKLAEGRFPLRTNAAKQIRKVLDQEYNKLPVATRWLYKRFGTARAKMGIRELKNVGALHQYHVLCDVSEAFVSQHEHTVYIAAEGPIQTT